MTKDIKWDNLSENSFGALRSKSKELGLTINPKMTKNDYIQMLSKKSPLNSPKNEIKDSTQIENNDINNNILPNRIISPSLIKPPGKKEPFLEPSVFRNLSPSISTISPARAPTPTENKPFYYNFKLLNYLILLIIIILLILSFLGDSKFVSYQPFFLITFLVLYFIEKRQNRITK